MKSYAGVSVRLTEELKMCFLVLGGATNCYWGHGLFFCMENLIFHLKKGYSVNY